MFKFNSINYLNKLSESPNDYYRGMNQASIDDQWDNTTQIYNVKEQVAYPFIDEYIEHEAWVNVVSDDLINYSKVYSDFIEVMFRDIDHKQNYKGQYYKITMDGEHEETYICYDRMNTITQGSDFKCVRCNNVMTWLDENDNVITMPCYLGTDISSTNNLIGKDGITPNVRMIILVQANEYTKSIVKNQRFMFQNSTAFKVEEVNNYMQEQGTNGEVTCVKIYITYSAIKPYDNVELNICDYYKNDYQLHIDQEEINQVNGFVGSLNAFVTNKEEIVEKNLIWETSDDKVVTITNDGQYEIVGNVGDSAIIKCYMEENNDVYDNIIVNVVSAIVSTPKIVIYPIVDSLDEDEEIEFNCNVYIDGEIQTDEVDCVASNVDKGYYQLTKNGNNYTLKNIHMSKKPLILTFSSDNCDDVILDIKLNGLL